MGVLVSILTTVLGMYLITIFSKKEKPLSKTGFMTSCIVTLVLFAALTYCFHQLAFENRLDYHDYRMVNDYIHGCVKSFV